MTRRYLLTAAAIAAIVAVLPASASAGVNLGATCDEPNYQTTALMQYAVDVSAPSYTVPAGGGIITRWATTRKTGAPVTPIKLKLFRLTTAPDKFTVVGENEQAAGAGFSQFVSHVPVSGGEQLGIFGGTTTPFCSGIGTTLNRAVVLTPAGDPAVGALVTATLPGGPQVVLSVAAYIEPDADGDGAGDESEDQCPSLATTQGPCPVPDTSGPAIDTKAFKLSKLLKKSKIEMTVGSNEAASVTLSGTISIPGGSSKTYTLKAVTKSVAAGGKTKIKLKVPKKALKKLRKKGKATSVINVSAKDAAGNTSTGKFTSKLKIVKTRRIIHR